MIITVTLNPAVDLSLIAPGWSEENVNRATEVFKSVGGKGINISRVLAEMSMPTMALTVVGGDSVQQFQRLARSIGCPIVYINIPGEIRTNIHITDPNDGRHLKVNQSGTPLDQTHFNHFKLLYRQHLRRASMVAIGGSLPPGQPADAYAQLVALAKDNNIPCLVDTVGPPLLAVLEHKPLIVKPNRHELAETLGADLDTIDDVVVAARELQERGARGVVISDGGRPLVGVWDDECYIAHPPRISVNGPTGAGDSLAAGLLAALVSELPFKEALARGVAASAATCLTQEGELARRHDIPRMERLVKVEEY